MSPQIFKSQKREGPGHCYAKSQGEVPSFQGVDKSAKRQTLAERAVGLGFIVQQAPSLSQCFRLLQQVLSIAPHELT